MRVIPDMTVLCPADAVSAKILLRKEFDKKGPAYIRLGRSGVPVVYAEDADLEIGKGAVLREGNDVAIIASGIMVAAALEAAETLASEGIHARVIDMHTIKPIDEDIIVKAAEECGCIVTAEEHSTIGGLGSAVCEVTASKCPCRVAMVGQHDVFGESGTPAELLRKYGMTAEDIANAVRGLR
jgi:transketolase